MRRLSDALLFLSSPGQNHNHGIGEFGDMKKSTPGRIRTCDLLIRSQLLYPAELRGLDGY